MADRSLLRDRSYICFVCRWKSCERVVWVAVLVSDVVRQKKENTLVSGNAGDEKKSSAGWPQNIFYHDLIELFK